MLRFDPTSIFNKSLEKLQQNPNWRAVANNSVISALLKSDAEINSETSRYAEYLFQETKWDTARNQSSILAMANMLGYQPKRKISARGTLYVSADPRTHLVGKTLSIQTFENLNKMTNASWIKPTTNLSIKPTCNVVDSKGNSYIATTTSLDRNSYYTTVEIMQGTRKSIFIDIDTIRNTSTSSKLDPYLYIPVKIKDCEDASNSVSKSFFRVYKATSMNGGQTLLFNEYRVVNTMLLTTSSDNDVEVYNDIYNQNLFYLKFNNDPDRGDVLDISRNTSLAGIRIDYVESAGAIGNLLDLFENFTLTDVTPADDTGGSYTLYGINNSAIIDGADEEAIYQIKKNAPKFYINNYTAGTKEAYENTIGNMDFNVPVAGGNITLTPKKVQVYGGTINSQSGSQLPATFISFLANNLEDYASTSALGTEVYEAIEESLNYYLAKLKSPQDTLRFVPPTYVPFTVGLTCKVSRENVDDLSQLEADIRNLVDTSWGANSDELDFGRNFFPSYLTTEIMNAFPVVKAISAEVEAVAKLDITSENVRRISPKPSEGSQDVTIKVMRIPYNFSPIFLGNKATTGFKDHRVGADYVMRIDVMYKKPNQMVSSENYHVSIFVPDVKTDRKDPFYLLKDTSQNGIWPTSFEDASGDYSELVNAAKLDNSKQYYYRDKVYSDNDFQELVDESSQEYIPTISSYLTSPGAVDDYLIYFSSNYEDSSATIGNVWIELSFDPIYRMLSNFALYDATLSEELAECPLPILKCGNDSATDAFETYKSILARYVDIYVSMRPIDSDLRIDTALASGGSSVLYIDSYDGATTSTNRSNLTADKRTRMISVTCEYEE